MSRILCAGTIFLLFALNSRADDASTKPEPFMEAITAALHWFSDLQDYYKKHQIEPAARDQSVRYLNRLSDTLSDLRQRKQNFTDALGTATFPGDERTLEQQAKDLISADRALQGALHDYTKIVPPNFKSSSTKLENDLSNGLAEKCGSLRDIAIQLTGSVNVNREQLVEKGNSTVKVIEALMQKVSDLTTTISTSGNQKKSNKQ